MSTGIFAQEFFALFEIDGSGFGVNDIRHPLFTEEIWANGENLKSL